MNQRIKALAEQAGIQMFEDRAFGWSVIAGTDHNVQRFAELIVAECAEVCYHHSQAAGGVDTAFGYGYKDCGNDIKRHFRVAE